VSATRAASSSIISVTLSARFVPSPAEKRPRGSPHVEDAAKPFLGPLSIITDKVEDSRFRVQEAKEAMKRMKSPSALAAGGISENIDIAFDHTEKMVNATRFLDKWKNVSDRLGFIVTAVDTIAEVRS